LHDLFVSVEAMTPGEYKSRAKGLGIGYGTIPTPFGTALAATTSRGLCGFWFLGRAGEKEAVRQMKRNWPGADFSPAPQAALKPLGRLFRAGDAGEREPFKIILKGTPFQLKVWEALLKIPEGCVASYQDVAKKIGEPGASWAVGTAVGHNLIAYLIPCHRVIRETGVLGNYRWGPVRKKALLAWEGSRFREGTKI
jgi:AraC family transcriptional regulator of adaptative response/methylated-DNA-[protein]-cysteine methyltransferase